MVIRFYVIRIAFVLAFIALAARFFYLQIIEHDKYEQLAVSQQTSDITVSAQRGTIYDVNGNALAVSATAHMVTIAPNKITDEETRIALSEGLAEILELKYEDVYAKANQKKSQYAVIARGVESDVIDKLTEFLSTSKKFSTAVSVTESAKRYYPHGNLLSTVLGFVGVDSQGLEGIEYMYDAYLKGTDGKIISSQNATGTSMPFEYEKYIDAEDGYDITLTVDLEVQYFLEKHIENTRVEHNVQSRVAGVVMNVKTGAILAMSNKPDFDPNDPFTIYDEDVAAAIDLITNDEEYNAAVSQARQTQWRNKAVSDLYEPGSVFKIITASAALDSGAATVNSGFYCKGHVSVGGWTIGCNNRAGHGPLTFTQALIESCNPSFIDMGQ